MAEQKEQYNQYIYEIKCTNGDKFDSETERYSSLLSSNEKLDWKLTVKDMQYVKEIYKPCWLKLSLNVANKEVNHANTASISVLYEYFNKASLTVKVKRVTNEKTIVEKTIVKNYYVMSVEPIQKPNATFSLSLTAYSADYKISLDKYSECYLNLPLNDLIKNNLGKLNTAIREKDGKHANIDFNCDEKEGLQVINYPVSGGKDYKVYHTPYAVQYDESFYAFIARLANRYGEFLFFEDGSLHLGVDPNLVNTNHKIKNDSDKPQFNSFSRAFQTGSSLEESISGTHYDYLNSKAKKEKSPYYNDIYEADDMNISLCLKNDNLSDDDNNWRDYMDWVGLSQKCVTFLTAFRREDGIGDHYVAAEVTNVAGALAKLSLAWVDAGFKAKAKVDKTNKNYTDAVKAFIEAAGEYKKEQMPGDSIRPFASFDTTEYILQQNIADKKKNYDDKSRDFNDLQTRLNQNPLDKALTSFTAVQDLSKSLAEKTFALQGKVETQKNVITELRELADTFNREANGTSSSGSTCSFLIEDAARNLNGAINESKTSKTAKESSKVSEAIKAAKKAFEDFKVNGNFNKSPSFVENIALTEFCNVPQSQLKDSELTAQKRNEMVSEIKGIYIKLKEELNAVSTALESNKKVVENILDAASKIADAEQEKNVAEEEYLKLYLKLVKSNLFHKALASVQQSETQIDRNRVKIEINTYNYDQMPLLGERLSFNGATYLIIKVDSAVTIVDGTSTFAETLKLELIPAVNKESKNSSNDGTTATETLWIPPMSDCRKMQKVGAMIAQVTDNVDPLAMGRLRVKYKWQSDSSCQSPWIRMATPYTSKNGAGMHFVPRKGDEVMVDFYNGNIDRPIVVGVLRNDTHDKDYTAGWEKRTDLTNGCGQQLAFSDGDITFGDSYKVLSGLGATFGAFNKSAKDWFDGLTIAKWGDSDDRGNNFQKYMRGGVSLTDNYGTWEISGNTSSRGVTISSRLGDITIDALTGISISAPLGDVSIAAKNINLQASNNISIESGTQIKRQRKIKKTFKNGIGKGITDTVKGVLKSKVASKVDLSLVRLMAEAIVPPVEGTLLVKSHRYLKLEAGEKAKADDFAVAPLLPQGEFRLSDLISGQKSFDSRKELYDKAADIITHNAALNAIPAVIVQACKERHNLRVQIFDAYQKLTTYKFRNTTTSVKIKKALDISADQALMNDLISLTDEVVNNKPEEKTSEFVPIIKKITDIAGDDLDVLNKFWPEDGEVLDPLLAQFNLTRKKEEEKDQVGARICMANVKAFIKLAHALAKILSTCQIQAETSYAENKAEALCDAMLPTNQDKIKGWELNEQTASLNVKNITQLELVNLFKPLFVKLYNYNDDTTGLPKDELNSENVQKSVVRIFLLATMNHTHWYYYKKEWADKKFEDLPEATRNSGDITCPRDGYILEMSSKDLNYYTTDATKNKEWAGFLLGCKFETEYWDSFEKEQGNFRQFLGVASDVVGLSDIIDDFASLGLNSFYESAKIKSSVHGGRVLISNNGVCVGIDKMGALQKTNLDFGKSDWK